jgi:ribosome-binding factor A
MSNRTLRVSELVQREISAYLHTRHQEAAVRITITAVVVSPDLRDGRVFYSVVGTPEEAEACGRWLLDKTGEIRHMIGQRIVLKQVPKFEFVRDTSAEHGVRMNQLLDELGPPAPPAPPP